MDVMGSAMWRRGRVPIGTFGMRLTLTDQHVTLQPRNMVFRVLWAALRAPALTADWEDITSVGSVTGLSLLPRQGLLFALRNGTDSFVFASWTMNEDVLQRAAEHGVRVLRTPRTFKPWVITSWGPDAWQSEHGEVSAEGN